MPTGKKIKQLRILPPIVIARFGSSPQPMENYELRLPIGEDGKPTTEYRDIVPAETLLVDPDSGAITAATIPSEMRFRDAYGRIKPVSPFLEVWAQFEGDDEFVPLTMHHLADLALSPSNLAWREYAANLKTFRSTGDSNDKVEADTGLFSDHIAHPLVGFCVNFKPGKSITFGNVRFICPTPAFPEIRARFTPGKGLVFGPRSNDPLTSDDVYAGQTADGLGFGGVRPRGKWDRYFIGNEGTPPVTAPGDVFQGEGIGVNDDSKLSHGYFDDTCDGILEVSLNVGTTRLLAYARFASSVPDFAPDSLPVRAISDDIEQMALGPDVPPPANDGERAALKTDVEDIVRRALDTVRQMNTAALNGDEPVADVPRFRNNMPGQELGSYNRKFEPIFPTNMATYLFALQIHKAILQVAIDSPDLEHAFEGRMSRVRMPEDVANLENSKRRLMPAMMRGSEGVELTLTRRQIAKLALADPAAQRLSPLAVEAFVAKKKPAALNTASLRRPIRSHPQTLDDN